MVCSNDNGRERVTHVPVSGLNTPPMRWLRLAVKIVLDPHA
jgi:hypothetical protein